MMSCQQKRHYPCETILGSALPDKRRRVENKIIPLEGVQHNKKRKRSDILCKSCVNNQLSSWRNIDFVSSRSTFPYSNSRTFQDQASENNYPSAARFCDEKLSFCCICNNSNLHKRQRNSEEDNMHLKLQPYIPDSGTSVDSDTDLSPEYNSFNYWKPVLPDIDVDLISTEVEPMETTEVSVVSPAKNEDAEFNSFNYWKMPMQDICVELLSL